MSMRFGPLLAVAAASLLCSTPALAVQAATKTSVEKPKPKESKVLKRRCENISPLGSRIATKRVCGTEAEWRDYQLQDRQAVEKAQMGPCVRGGGC